MVDQYTFDPAEVAKLQIHQGLTAHTGLTNKGTGIGGGRASKLTLFIN